MTAIYYAGFAIALFAALQSIPLSTANQNKHVYRAYLFLCAFTAIFLLCTARFLAAETLESAATLAKWQGIGAFGYCTSFIWLMANYAESRSNRKIMAGLIAFTLVAIATTAYSFTLPYGLFIDNVQIHGKIAVFGGEITRYSYDYRPQSSIFQIMGYLSIIWGAWCCRQLWLRANRFAAVLITSYLVILTIAYSLQLLFNFGFTTAAPPGGTTYLWLFLIMSLCFGRDHQQVIAKLNKQSLELHDEIDRRREAELKFKQQAYTDELTGLPNQLELRHQLHDLLLQSNHGLTLALIQIDRFREIKQVFSEINSENILQEIARRLKLDVPDNILVARLSEQCFAVLGETIPPLKLDRKAGSGSWSKNCQLIEPYQVGHQLVEITFSAGVIDTTEEDTAQTALYKAEHALDEAAKSGHGSIIFYSEAFAHLVARQQLLEGDLKNAITRNELSLHYQPIVNDQLQIDGAEALLRWRHPDLGMISPAEFIPLAERSGLMTAIGNWVFNAACQQIAQWRSSDLDFRGRLSINVSPWQLQTEDFAESVLTLLKSYDVLPDWLTLELTESALVDNFDMTRYHLGVLREAGIKVALDDFGTGFSSLAYLSQLPLDTLKIDKVFIDDVEHDRGRKLLASMLNIGNALELKVVLEGVETQAQYQTLKALGCTHYQGYLFSRPLPSQELESWADKFNGDVIR